MPNRMVPWGGGRHLVIVLECEVGAVEDYFRHCGIVGGCVDRGEESWVDCGTWWDVVDPLYVRSCKRLGPSAGYQD